MLKASARPAIRLRGVRHNNLKNVDLDLPLNQLVVITGLSGSGKSSLAFDTLFAEGQRRYIETFSPYARQFFDRMDKPQVDSIEGIPPAIAIEQRNAVRTTRSTVGTMTEICDHLKMLWPHLAQLHCRQCGRPVHQDSPAAIGRALLRDAAPDPGKTEVLVTFDLPLTDKLPLADSLALIARQGYQRLLWQGQVVRLEDIPRAPRPAVLTVVQDRLRLAADNRARLIEACEQAYHFGKGKLAIREMDAAQNAIRTPRRFSNRRHCAECDLEYRDPTPALFSFNHPVGACPTCRGFGRIISIDYDLALPDRSRTLAQGVVKPWQTGLGAECQDDLLRLCRKRGVPTDVPFHRLPRKWQKLVIDGDPKYGQDPAHEWPRAWYGVKGYFRWLESKAYKMHVRVLLSRYRAYTPCPDCRGQRLQPEALLYRCRVPDSPPEASRPRETRNPPGAAPPPPAPPAADGPPRSLTLADFYQLPIREALPFIEALAGRRLRQPHDPLALVLGEVRARLSYLNEVGLGYLTLDRPTRTLSGGETERVSLTTCLGTRLVNTLFVLDEPSVGLHARDTDRLVRLLEQLRAAGNTVVVVEHEARVIRAADQVIDLGPGHGAAGGEVVFQGAYPQLLRSPRSLTGQYLSGRRRIELPPRRAVNGPPPAHRPGAGQAPPAPANASRRHPPASTRAEAGPVLRLSRATRHNLKNLAVEIPLGRFVCVTGVSGSGKTTLVREVLLPALAARLQSTLPPAKASDRLASEENHNAENHETEPRAPHSAILHGAEHLGRVALVDQSILGKTPRSNPAVYIGAFDDIRAFFAQSEPAQQRGLNASAFSFNSPQGQCERCRGAGFEKIEMQFLSDVFIRCPDCDGRRYRAHILAVKVGPKTTRARRPAPAAPRRSARSAGARSIADLLDATVEEAIAFLGQFPESRPAQRAVESLKLLAEVGLGYLKLGQPINTLSGGESQRLKLVRHLAEVIVGTATPGARPAPAAPPPPAARGPRPPAPRPTLFLFDEPTTGLHFDDVRVLLQVFQRLVDAGHSVLVIEHNLDVIKSADWLIDLGPDAGDQGGRIVAVGTPEQVAACPRSHTGQALRPLLAPQPPAG
ncbi:MAG: excinuclease ABC subunit UvrA [Verrucomicrobia bacterium]|nr:excinuclease ABC subunit UvrA [Verrucomicrobiota bacterium]